MDMEVELPPPVEGDSDAAEGSDAESDVELPPNYDGDLNEPPCEEDSPHCGCRLKCHEHFVIEELRASNLALTPEEHSQTMFEFVKRHICQGNKHRICWTINGHHVCRPFFEFVHVVGHATLDRYIKMARSGVLVLPERENMPRMPRMDAGRQAAKADSWFLDLYRNLAEPQAIADNNLIDESGCEVVTDTNHPLWCIGINLPGDAAKRKVPIQYMNPGSFEDLWSQYQAEKSAGEQVSKSTLYKAYRTTWSHVLKFRNIGQGKRCKICAKFDEERAQATTEEERVTIAQAKRTHIDEVLADRAVVDRAIKISEKDAANPTGDGHNQLLTITIDGMDQAKFRVPRNLASSAEFESLWRPQLHVTGTIVHGHLECYFIMDADQAKDSNMNATVIARTLDLVKQKTGQSLPRNIAIQADNTTRESKNQHFATFTSYLVASEKFDASETQFLQVGHTHNGQDQRFSTVATVLSRAPVLEDVHDFADWIRNNVQPARGRQLHVEILGNTFDFQAWFSKLGM